MDFITLMAKEVSNAHQSTWKKGHYYDKQVMVNNTNHDINLNHFSINSAMFC